MNADAMTDEQYRIYNFSNFFDLKNLPNDEFERAKRFEDSNIFNCSSVIASAFICHLAHRGVKPRDYILGLPYDSSMPLVCGFVVGVEAEVEFLLIIVFHFNHHRLLAVLLVPGCNFIVAWRKLQIERSTLLRHAVERMIEDADERAHPLMNVASNRQRHFRIREFGLVYDARQRLSDVKLRILFRPGMDVVQRHVAVL